MSDDSTDLIKRRIATQKRLLKWRIVLQWIGGVIMVPSVLLAWSINFGWIPTSWAQWLLLAVLIAFVPLLGSIVCTLTVNKMRRDTYKISVKADEERNAAWKAEQAAKAPITEPVETKPETD